MDKIVGYPRLLRRIQALLIDGVIVPASAIATLIVLSKFGVQGINAALSAGLIIFILEPVLVSIV